MQSDRLQPSHQHHSVLFRRSLSRFLNGRRLFIRSRLRFFRRLWRRLRFFFFLGWRFSFRFGLCFGLWLWFRSILFVGGFLLPLFLDLPLMRGDEVPHAPHVCATAQDWPGAVALYGADLGGEFALEELLPARATVGLTRTELLAGPIGRWDRGADLEVELIAGTLDSQERLAVLGGANRLAIGDGSPENWEVIQFAEAELIAPNRYLIRNRLRGQYGSDGVMPVAWPVGSYVVLMDAAVEQLDLAISQRRIARDYRFGPARRAYDDPSYVALSAAFDGAGLRPYAPVHLRTPDSLGNDMAFHWIRRTRIEGDSWDMEEVPLGEESERYRVQVLSGTTVLRDARVSTPAWVYAAAMQISDGASPGDVVQVAQISARYGAGPVAEWILG